MVRRMATVGARGIADAAGIFRNLFTGRVAKALGTTATAYGRGSDGRSEGSVHEVGDAAARAAFLHTRVGGGKRERRTGEHGQGAGHHRAHGTALHSRKVSGAAEAERHVRAARNPPADWRGERALTPSTKLAQAAAGGRAAHSIRDFAVSLNFVVSESFFAATGRANVI